MTYSQTRSFLFYKVQLQMPLWMLFLIFPFVNSFGQQIHHWETVVYHDMDWQYFIGSESPPQDWMLPNYNDSAWTSGQGGIGYGDGDDNTIIDKTVSLYLRMPFDILDPAELHMGLLHADYDDGFVAYLNGTEIARSNVGNPPDIPGHLSTTITDHEAKLYAGGLPEMFAIKEADFKNLIKEEENILAIQVHNHSQFSTDMTSNFFFSVAKKDSVQTYGVVPDWFHSSVFSTELPLLVIRTTETEEIPDEPKVPAHLGIVNNGPGMSNSIWDEFNEYDGEIAIEIRGASSQGFPKKNYGFETQLPSGENNNVKLLGMPKENDWILHGPYSDKSLLRNKLVYHMGRKTDRYAPRTRLVELFINEDYRGVYILTERIKIDKNRVDISMISENDFSGDALTGGYLVQIDRNGPPPNDGWFSVLPDWHFVAFDDPDYDEIIPAQAAYIKSYFDDFESAMFSDDYLELYEDFVDVDSWVDYFLITEISKHIDAYRLSFFIHKKKESKGGKLHFGPLWDYNLGFGNFNYACSPAPQGWSFEFGETCDYYYPFWIQKMTNIPQVSHQINCRWAELRSGPLHTDSLFQFIDDNVALLEEPSIRNFERWPVLGTYVWPNDFVGESYEAEVMFLKSWLFTRLKWMDYNMIGDCNLYVSNEEDVMESPAYSLFPNPSKDIVRIQSKSYFDTQLIVNISDLYGKSLLTFETSFANKEIDISHLAAGTYIYSIISNNREVGTGKLIKQQD